MKNFLAPIKNNQIASGIMTEVGKFYSEHKGIILTGGTITFSLAATASAMKNSREIFDTVDQANAALAQCTSQEQKNQVYMMTIRALAPLIAPIVIFEGLTITCTILQKKNSDAKDKRIAELASALSIAQQAVTYYQNFQKQAEESLGEKKYAKLQEDIYKSQEVDGRRFTSIASEGAPGEVLIIDKYSGRPFWSTTGRIEMAARELGRRLSPDGGYDQVSINDLYDLIGNTDLTPNELGERFGYITDSDWNNDIAAHFADTHYIFPNGTKIPAFEMFLYPEPGCIDWGC